MTAPLSDHPAPSRPTAAQVAEFHDQGLVVFRGLFSPNEVRRLGGAFTRMRCAAAALALQGRDGDVEHQGAHYVLDGRAIQRVVWCAAADPVADRFGEDPRLLAIASALLGDVDEADHLVCQAHFKLPGDGVSFPFHQDSAHRRYGTDRWSDVNGLGSYVQTVVAIDPMTADNGPLLWIPGSCRRGHLPTADGARHLPPDAFDPAEARPALLAPGDVAAFGPYTIHGSRPNPGPSARRIFINGFAAPGANRRRYPGYRSDGTGAGRRVRLSAGR